MNPRTGRPPLPKDQRRTIMYRIRLNPTEKAAIDAAGNAEWARDVLLRAAKRKR